MDYLLGSGQQPPGQHEVKVWPLDPDVFLFQFLDKPPRTSWVVVDPSLHSNPYLGTRLQGRHLSVMDPFRGVMLRFLCLTHAPPSIGPFSFTVPEHLLSG